MVKPIFKKMNNFLKYSEMASVSAIGVLFTKANKGMIALIPTPSSKPLATLKKPSQIIWKRYWEKAFQNNLKLENLNFSKNLYMEGCLGYA